MAPVSKRDNNSGVIWGLDINPRHDGNLLLGDSGIAFLCAGGAGYEEKSGS